MTAFRKNKMNMKHLLGFLALFPLALAPANDRVLAQEAHLPPGMVLKLDGKPQNISFSNGDVRLAGVLVEPEGKGPFPAVVLVHGSGPQMHDQPAFIVHANAFLKEGFAVLAYDKRGSGSSTGELESSDYDDLARDVAAAVTFLRARPAIAATKIGLLGRSEGGWVSSLAASHDPKIAFVIMSSGCAVGPLEETLYETRRGLQESGVSTDLVEQAAKFKTALWEFDRRVAAGKTSAETLRSERAMLLKQLADLHQAKVEQLPYVMDPEVEDRRKFAAIANMIFYDPQPALNALRAPLLEAIGTDDEAVDPATTLATLEKLRTAGRNITTRTFPGVGHSLLKMQGATILGYADGYLDFIVAWSSSVLSRQRPASK
jgi:pimeloyl-ACP methyl ester carboxylesterase